MKKLIFLSALVLVGCNNETSGPPSFRMLTYDELVAFEPSCNKANTEQPMLKSILERKNFDTDPDNLNPEDRAYNSRLKATIWWYEYRCKQ